MSQPLNPRFGNLDSDTAAILRKLNRHAGIYLPGVPIIRCTPSPESADPRRAAWRKAKRRARRARRGF